MSNWRRVDSVITYYGKGVTPKYVENSSIIVLNQKCIRNNKIDYSLAQFIDDTKNYNEDKFLKIGDVLINSTGQGTAGRVSIVENIPDGFKVITDSHILVLRTNNFYESKCLNYSLFSIESLLQTFMDGSTGQGEFDKVRLFNVNVGYSDDNKSQQKIAAVLSALDDKIEVNNKINAELEAMAKTLYDYWFVQFEFPITNESHPELVSGSQPVGYKSAGGKMAYNPTLKREIPEGWEAVKLGELSKLVRGVSYSKDDIKLEIDEESLPILRATNITKNKVDINNPVLVPSNLVSNEQILNPFDILITMSSGSIEHIGKNGFYLNNEKVSFGAFCAKIVPISGFKFYLYNYLQSDFVSNTIKNECLGTNINNLNSSLVNSFRIVNPDFKILEAYNKIVEPIFFKIKLNTQQNQELAQLRDWLLPMLMNGQVTVE